VEEYNTPDNTRAVSEGLTETALIVFRRSQIEWNDALSPLE